MLVSFGRCLKKGSKTRYLPYWQLTWIGEGVTIDRELFTLSEKGRKNAIVEKKLEKEPWDLRGDKSRETAKLPITNRLAFAAQTGE